jgi:hypothetical protein
MDPHLTQMVPQLGIWIHNWAYGSTLDTLFPKFFKVFKNKTQFSKNKTQFSKIKHSFLKIKHSFQK